MKPLLTWLAAAAGTALCGIAMAAPEAVDPRLREVVYDPRAVVTVPVKRGVVTLVKTQLAQESAPARACD